MDCVVCLCFVKTCNFKLKEFSIFSSLKWTILGIFCFSKLVKCTLSSALKRYQFSNQFELNCQLQYALLTSCCNINTSDLTCFAGAVAVTAAAPLPSHVSHGFFETNYKTISLRQMYLWCKHDCNTNMSALKVQEFSAAHVIIKRQASGIGGLWRLWNGFD